MNSKNEQELRKDVLQAIVDARTDLLDFTQFNHPEYKVNWHHRLVSDKLMGVYEGRIKRLMIFQPPRTGKSELVSRQFPAFCLGRNPAFQIIGASYGSDLANSMNLDIQKIMGGEDYRFLFPNSPLPGYQPTQSRKLRKYRRTSNVFDLAVEGGGYYKSVGIGGPLTGFGFNIGIIDDPIKERKKAESAMYRQDVFDWYTSTFLTRKQRIGDFEPAIIITLTRWHDDDLAGRLIKAAQENPLADQWDILCLPLIKDDEDRPYDPRKKGETLWEEWIPQDECEKIRINTGPRDFASLFQQSPAVEGGNIFRSEWFQFYDTGELPRNFDIVIQSWDFTFKKTESSDFVVGQVWGRKGPNKYLLDQVRGRMGFTESVQAMRSLSAKWPEAMTKYVEEKANGAAIIDTLKKEMSGIVPINPKESKESRAHAITGQFQAGNVLLPKYAPWLHDYLEEHKVFPSGQHDDQVDATTQALLQLTSGSIERLERMLG